MKDLPGKVSVVAGGTNGIGLAIVRAFLAEEMQVVIADVDPTALGEVEGGFTGNSRVMIQQTDVTSATSMAALADAVFSRFGACHILCNNAGVGAPSAKVWETTPNDWAWVLGVNVMGVAHGILEFVPRIIASGEEGPWSTRPPETDRLRPCRPPRSTQPAKRRCLSSRSAWRFSWPKRTYRSVCPCSIHREDCCGRACGPQLGRDRPNWPANDPGILNR